MRIPSFIQISKIQHLHFQQFDGYNIAGLIKMSIYSGFSTRKEEDKYNKLLGRLITTLQNHILELTSGNIGLSYFTQYSNITTKLQSIEEHKFLSPKFTQFMVPLLKICKKNFDSTQPKKAKPINLNLQEVKEEDQFMLHQQKTIKDKKVYLDRYESVNEQKKNRSYSELGNPVKKRVNSIQMLKPYKNELGLEQRAKLSRMKKHEKLGTQRKYKRDKKLLSNSLSYLDQHGFTNPFTNRTKTQDMDYHIYK